MKAVSPQLCDLGAPKSPFQCLEEAVALLLGRAGQEPEGKGLGPRLCWWGGGQETAGVVCTVSPYSSRLWGVGFPLSILGPPGR